MLFQTLNGLLQPIRQRREAIAGNEEYLREVLAFGEEKARKKAGEGIRLVKEAMNLL